MQSPGRMVRRAAAVALLLEGALLASCWPGNLDTLTDDANVDVADAAPKGDASFTTDASVTGDASSVADARADAGSAYANAVLADEPSAYWPFEDPAGSILAADVAGSHPATPQGNVLFGVPGAVGMAVRLDGQSDLTPGDYFDILGASAFAVEFWARPDDGDAGDQNVVMKGMYRGTSGYVAYFRAGPNVQFEETWAPDSERSAFKACPISNGFVHVVATLDTKNLIHIYVNGVEAALADETSAEGGPIADGDPLFLGQSFTGVIDEVALYDHSLSAEQVAAHYLAASR
jgi:hypothetical protein